MRFHWFAVIPMLALVSSSAVAVTPVEVRQYAATRSQSITSLPIDTLKSNPSAYVGKVFEVRGSVTGLFGNPDGQSMIISTRGGDSFSVGVEDALPVETPGAELACLVKIGERSVHSLSDLRLVACTFDIDLRRLEEAWAKLEQEKAARSKAAQEAKAQQQTAAKQWAQTGSDKVSSEDLVCIYTSAVKGFNPKLKDSQAETIARSVLGFSYRYKVDPRLVCSVILAESHFRIGATSGAGAQGLGQLMPSTAAGLGVNNAYDPVENVYGSVRYIRSMLDRMSGNKKWNDLTWYDLALALAAYNAGPGAVKKYGGIPPYRETQAYVRKVTSIYKQLCGVK